MMKVCLSINYYHDEYLKKQDLYRKDQSVFESRIYENKNGENEIIKITLFDEQKIEFTSFDEFKAYFISLFIKGPFTYLISIVLRVNNYRYPKLRC